MKRITMLFFVTLAATLMWTSGNAQTDLPLMAQKATNGALSSGNDSVNLYNILADDTNTVVFEQTEGGGNGIVSDYYVPVNGGAYSADDFTLANETDIHLFKFQGFAGAAEGLEAVLGGFQLYVYADDGGSPAGYPSGPDAAILELDLDWDEINGPDDGLSFEKVEEEGFYPVYIVTIDVEEATGDALTLVAGSYWVVIAAKINVDFELSPPRFNWSSSLDMNGELPKLSDPQELFGSDENWVDINILTAGTDFNALAFTVYGPPLDACTEAVAGTVVGDTEIEVCALSPFSMSIEGNSDPATGLIRTWQSSPTGAGTWTDLDVSSSTITIAGIDTPTDYRYHVECDNGDSDDSEVIEVSLNPNPSECYCIPEGTNSDRYIDNFTTTGGVENISNLGSGFSTGGYGDFTAMTVEANPGDELSFTADIEGGTAGFRIWVDWNQDGAFDATEEVAYQSAGYLEQHTGTFTVPTDAMGGTTRMRVVSHWLSTSGDVDPCETGFTYGEFEDYTVIVSSTSTVYCTPELDCTGGDLITNVSFQEIDNTTTCSPDGYGDYTSMIATVQAGETFPISVSVGDGWANESVSVWIDFDNNGTFEEDEFFYIGTGSDEALTGNIAIPADATNGDYRMRVRVAAVGQATATWDMSCDESQGYGETEDYTVTVEEATAIVYCTPELDCTGGDLITNVTFQEIDNTTDCSPDGYGDFTNMVATVQSGGTYPISVTVGDGFTHESVSVWIDFDNSGTFEEDEFFYIGTGSDEVVTGDISIPAAAAEGDYRMRVRVAAVSEGLATWDMACDESQGYGETEDYTVTVDDVVGTDDFSATDFTYYPNPMGDVLYITANKDIESISAYNVLGQEVLSSKHFADGKVDVSSLPTGTFMFRVTFESGQVENFKVLKK